MEQGLSLRAFGQKANMHPFHVMAIELGQHAATTRTLMAIANALGVSTADLLTDVESDEGAIVDTMRRDPSLISAVHQRVTGLVQN
jgi:transcriptional regulator with XRE-family HTH domain